MCRLLFCATDFIDARTGTSTDFKYKRGDLVEVFDDGKSFGTGIENNKKFRIVELPGVNRNIYVGRTSPDTELIIDPISGWENPNSIRIRLFVCDLTNLETLAGIRESKTYIDAEKITALESEVIFFERSPKV